MVKTSDLYLSHITIMVNKQINKYKTNKKRIKPQTEGVKNSTHSLNMYNCI